MNRLLLAALGVSATIVEANHASQYVHDVWRDSMNTEGHSKANLKGKFMSTELRHFGVFIGSMTMYVSHPDIAEDLQNRPAGHYPVVVIAHHAVGIYHATFLREFADGLAAKGYIAVLPDMFHRVWSESTPTGDNASFEVMNVPALLQSLQDAQVMEDLRITHGFVARNADAWKADPRRIAVVGFCMGGRIAWLSGVSTEFARVIRGVVAYHGGNMFKTWPVGGAESDTPGSQLSKLHCPVLGHFGDQDKNPSPEDMGVLRERSQASGQEVEFHVYAGANHGFSCRDSSNYLATAAETAWQRTLDFLSRTLSSSNLDAREPKAEAIKETTEEAEL